MSPFRPREMRSWIALAFSCALLLAVAPAAVAQDQGTWTQLGPMPITNAEMGAGELDGKVYLVGGFNDLTGLWIYDPKSDSWSRAADMPFETHHPGVKGVDGLLYVVGGFNIENQVQIYDPSTATWSRGADSPVSHRAQATVVLDGRIHSIGGTFTPGGGGGEDHHVAYDPATDTWETLAPLRVPREHGYAAVVDGRIYFVAGRYGNFSEKNDLQIYDPKRDRWTYGPALPAAASGHAVQAVGGLIYAIGGEQPRIAEVLQLTQVYDPSADAWSQAAPPPTRIHAAGNVVMGNSIYLFGGLDLIEESSDGRDWVYRFDPPVRPAPSRLRARALKSGAVRVKWKFRANKSDATEIEIQIRAGGGEFATQDTVGPKVRKLIIKGLAPGTYAFRARAEGPSGASGWSDEVVVEISG